MVRTVISQLRDMKMTSYVNNMFLLHSTLSTAVNLSSDWGIHRQVIVFHVERHSVNFDLVCMVHLGMQSYAEVHCEFGMVHPSFAPYTRLATMMNLTRPQ